MSTNVDGVSASTFTTTATKCHSHILKIQGYSHTKLLIDGASLESKTFEAGGCTWRIVFFCLALVRADSFDRPVSAQVLFTLVPHPATTRCSSSFRWTFRRRGDNRSAPPSPLITRAELQGSEYLVDDSFAVRCDVTVVSVWAMRDKVVQSCDLERAGIACSCKEQLCNRRHASSWVSSKSETTPPSRRRRGFKAAWFWLLRRALP
ncbi:hypothetical protein VPH35_084852 [Triticum aestivum]